jgi:hypothetical protein
MPLHLKEARGGISWLFYVVVIKSFGGLVKPLKHVHGGMSQHIMWQIALALASC